MSIGGISDTVAPWGCMLIHAHSLGDNRIDGSGLDDGPYLPGHAPRKPLPSKSPEEHAATRAKAWATRRAKYGERGHR